MSVQKVRLVAGLRHRKLWR